MRQMFPDGRGGPFEVPGVGRVIDGEEFDYPSLCAGCVPVEGAEDTPGEGAGDGEGGEDEAAEAPSEPQKTRAKGARL